MNCKTADRPQTSTKDQNQSMKSAGNTATWPGPAWQLVADC